MAGIVVCLLFLPLLAWVATGKNPPSVAWEDQTPEEHLAHFRQMALCVMLQECTNEVPGIAHIISTRVDDSSGNVAN